MSADKNFKDILARLVELIGEDKELHDAVVSLINSKATHERALANVADAKRKKLEIGRQS